jgi:hypothetical protein
LLNLDITGSKIAEAGLDAPSEFERPSDVDTLEELVDIFWQRVHEKFPGAIPSGMIFLPGEKLNRPGFGWATRTWLSPHEMNHPDPLNFLNNDTILQVGRGLGVHYPGFLLYPNSKASRENILGTSKGPESTFSLPIDRSLDEWYSVQGVDDRTSGEITRLAQSDNVSLAIILSGPLPKERPKEIALLVEIYRCEAPATLNNPGRAPVELYVRIIHRLYVWRDTNRMKTQGEKLQFKAGSDAKDHCLGEYLGPTQRWWVDGYQAPKNPEMTVPENSQPAHASGQSVHENGEYPQIRQTWTFYERVVKPNLAVLSFWNGSSSSEERPVDSDVLVS